MLSAILLAFCIPLNNQWCFYHISKAEKKMKTLASCSFNIHHFGIICTYSLKGIHLLISLFAFCWRTWGGRWVWGQLVNKHMMQVGVGMVCFSWIMFTALSVSRIRRFCKLNLIWCLFLALSMLQHIAIWHSDLFDMCFCHFLFSPCFSSVLKLLQLIGDSCS